VPIEYVEKEKAEQLNEIAIRNAALMRRSLPSTDSVISRAGRSGKALIVLLIDDGMATGATGLVSARWLKSKFTPHELIVGTPIASRQSVDLLGREGFRVESIFTPKSFVSVNQFYKDFDQNTDDKVAEILTKASVKSKLIG
jgi:predicted phosphoribosyltransferase